MMENVVVKVLDAEYKILDDQFKTSIIESFWSDHGELIYVVKDDVDLKKFATTIKNNLKTNCEIESNFIGKVTYANQSAFERFDYISGYGDDFFTDALINFKKN